jgi:phosphatidylglycerol lysyltransferase
MEALLLKYGYAVLFLGVLVEGEAFVVAGGILAHRGLLSLPIVLVLSVVANSITNQFYFFAARARGRQWLEARYGSHKRYHQVVELMSRHGSWLLVFNRYAYGFRMLICAACGALGMEVPRFTLLSILSGVAWAVPTGIASYYAGGTVVALLHRAHRYGLRVGIGLALVAATFVGVRHIRRAATTRDMKLSDLNAIVPFLVGVMGLLNIVSGIFPRSPKSQLFLEHYLPIVVRELSRPVMLFAGLALLEAARGLARRRSLSWDIAASALAVSVVSHIGRGLDLPLALAAGGLLVALISIRRRFYAVTPRGSLLGALLMAPPALGLVLLYGAVGFGRGPFAWSGPSDPWGEALRQGVLGGSPRAAPLSPRAEEFLTSLSIAGWLGRGYLLVLCLRPLLLRKRREAKAPVVLAVARAHGRRSLSALAPESDKRHLLVGGGAGLIAYGLRRGVAVACGDPLSAEDAFRDSLREFLDYARRRGWLPSVYFASESRLEDYKALGLEVVEIAREAVVPLERFRGLPETTEVKGYDSGSEPSPALDEELEAISEEWLRERHTGEYRFSCGRFDPERLKRSKVFVPANAGSVHAFCTFLPYDSGRAARLDVLRSRAALPGGNKEALVSGCLVRLREAGLLEASLGSAPDPSSPLSFLLTRIERSGLDLGRFSPSWEARYLAFPGGADISRIAKVVEAVHGAGARP